MCKFLSSKAQIDATENGNNKQKHDKEVDTNVTGQEDEKDLSNYSHTDAVVGNIQSPKGKKNQNNIVFMKKTMLKGGGDRVEVPEDSEEGIMSQESAVHVDNSSYEATKIHHSGESFGDSMQSDGDKTQEDSGPSDTANNITVGELQQQ
ncbi:hypothetical protein K7X08_032336 [Anisodus acutangulus]|uniref:Uncharacterized protein n=1 Tax=Anisodus acutangulus TaxID=402998 RepID=A0A9Q1RBV4_9SOLA|nr:hypothetical protein K7X08_032336 [Anisodus acutangulus]